MTKLRIIAGIVATLLVGGVVERRSLRIRRYENGESGRAPDDDHA
jgi:hypothetical protein